MIGAALSGRVSLRAVVAAALGVAIAVGVVLRFENLSGQVFYGDEAFTAMRVSGYQDRADLRPLFDGRIRPIAELHRLEQIGGGRGPWQTVASLAAEDSQHPPLFYLIDRALAGALGSSIAAYRLAAAIIGVLAIFAAWLLGSELFGARTGAVMAALFALSPFEVLYAHEAREYTLIALMTLLTSYLLLRAVRTLSLTSWVLYGISVGLGLYANPLIALVVVSHAVYALTILRTARAKAAFAVAIVLPGAVFAPWALVMLAHKGLVSTEIDWGATQFPLRQFVEKWMFNAGAQFFDLAWVNLKYAAVAAVILAFAAYALVLLVRTSPASRWAFVLLLGGVTLAAFLGYDLMQHSHWSTIARYVIPTWIALQLAVAYALERWAFEEGAQRSKTLVGIGALALLIVLEGWSSVVGTRADVWYGNQLSGSTPGIMAYVNAARRPTLVIGEKTRAFYLNASNYLDPGVDVELFQDARNARIRTAGFADAFATTPTPALREALTRQGYRLVAVFRYASASSAYLSFHQAVRRGGIAGSDTVPGSPNTLYRVARNRRIGKW